MFEFCVPTLFGIESVAAGEFRRLGFDDVRAETGKITFKGDELTLAKANLWSRSGERVLLVMGRFSALDFDALFDGVHNIPWENFIPRDGNFPVNGYSRQSVLTSIPACQSIIKKAIVKRLSARYRLSRLPEDGASYKVKFAIVKDVVEIYLDTSGDALHKRGYRAKANEAPLRETLAAAMVDFARFRGNREGDALLDPFCGSGTIVIEAALKAANIAPGAKRSFDAEKWNFIDKKIWRDARTEALDLVKVTSADMVGSDIDPKTVELARSNARKAGVEKLVQFRCADALRLPLNEYKGTIVTNPPYGMRLLDAEESERIYKGIASKLRDMTDKQLYVLSGHPEFERVYGRRADKKRKLYNGMIPCGLFCYDGMFARPIK